MQPDQLKVGGIYVRYTSNLIDYKIFRLIIKKSLIVRSPNYVMLYYIINNVVTLATKH